MDFTKLRAAALKDGDDEEAVTVNTRALIDKVLARYSGEWTTLRELIQNAADAQASKVTIKFETLPSVHVPTPTSTNSSEVLKHVLQNHTLRRLLVTNNGHVFGINDWSRLKRIAEGNPDETKIGAFGVGFYSVFADCEEPFVSSGNEAMAFYWKGNSLFTRRLQLRADEGNPNTSFVLDYRNSTTPMPNLLSIAQFLATSLTFVALQNIELWVDDWSIVSLQKKPAPSIEVPIGRDFETRTKNSMMQVQSMERESIQMDATFMNVVGWKPSISASKTGNHDGNYGSTVTDIPSLRSFFSKLTSNSSQAALKNKAIRDEKALQEIVLEDLTAMTTANVFLRVTTAVVRTYVSASFTLELERATKKPPPKTTKMAILTSSYDETEASSRDSAVAKGVDIYASVLPSKKPGGRVFIGFPTHQTTGAGFHVSAPSVIPTVERESIDLNARWVRTWNEEMLRIAGIMARLAYSSEMFDLSAKIKRAAQLAGHGTKVTKDEITKHMPEALHILRNFSFAESTPSSKISQIIEEAFWTAYKHPSIEIYSTRGVLMTTQVRLATEDLSGFVEGIPVSPAELVKLPIVMKLIEFGLLTEITVSDVKKELEAKALSQEQLVQFIGWAGLKTLTGNIDAVTIHSLVDVAVAMTGSKENSGIIALGGIKNYLNIKKIPDGLPLPETTLPFQFTKACPINQLQALGWEELEIVPWLRFLIETNSHRPSEQNLTKSIPFAAYVLQVLSKSWDGLKPSSKASVSSLLQPLAMVPTKSGQKKPGEAFLANVKLFEDLPTITSCPGVKEKFLASIGVRKTVDLETIFTRLLAPTSDTLQGSKSTRNRHMELIKYLASVRDDIPAEDLKRLKNTATCPAEAGPPGHEFTLGTTRLLKVSELFEPKDSLRDLGLPIIQWPGPPGSYRATSSEGRFLTALGLRAFPSALELIDMMASEDKILSDKAMFYFIANHHLNGYGSFSMCSKAFLPLQGESRRAVPEECFTNEKCSILGFSILKRELAPHANKFNVAMDPPITLCVTRLIDNPPKNKQDATALFSYFSERLGEIRPNLVARLHDALIVPGKQPYAPHKSPDERCENSSSIRLLTPHQCYLGTSSTYGEIFEFVDFGNTANAFLLKCGSKIEPTTLELASLACKEPARLLGVMQSPEKYLNLLRTLADDFLQLSCDRVLFNQMKQSKWLLGSVEITGNTNKPKMERQDLGEEQYDSDPDDIEDTPVKEFQLASPDQIVIIDDYSSYRLFKRSLISAPEEEKLEELYLALGARTLGSLVHEDLRLGRPSEKQASAVKLRAHIFERSKLFLHEHRRDSIKHDVKWLEKNLSVQVVSSIALKRSLKGHNLSHIEKRSAACTNERRVGWTLYVIPGGYDSYQISHSLCRLLLERPSHSAYLTFESFLSLNLYQLRSRGYNVERILRAKAAEQRIAEEERMRQLEIEQQQIKEQEQQWKNQEQLVSASARQENLASARQGKESSEKPIPGAFEDSSPENSPPPIRKKPRGLFSGISRRLGLHNSASDEIQDQLSNFLGRGPSQPTQQEGTDNPPSYDEANKGKVTSPATLQQNLLNAIKASRAHDSDSLFSPPNTETIREQASYCDATPSQNISFIADANNGARIFASKTLDEKSAREFLSNNVAAINSFADVLYDVADIYSVPRKAMHIFYDDEGATIAFNLKGSVFCNFRFFNQLHSRRMNEGDGRMLASSYWWVVVAHELAHNVVRTHSAEHSFYTESLISHYFPKMMQKASAYLKPINSPPIAGPSTQKEQMSLLD